MNDNINSIANSNIILLTDSPSIIVDANVVNPATNAFPHDSNIPATIDPFKGYPTSAAYSIVIPIIGPPVNPAKIEAAKIAGIHLVSIDTQKHTVAIIDDPTHIAVII